MIYADDIIINDADCLTGKNLIQSVYAHQLSTMSKGTSSLQFTGDIKFIKNHIYYYRTGFRFTSNTPASNYITKVMLDLQKEVPEAEQITLIENPTIGTNHTLSCLYHPIVDYYIELVPNAVGSVISWEDTTPGNGINSDISVMVGFMGLADVTKLYNLLVAANLIQNEEEFKNQCDNYLYFHGFTTASVQDTLVSNAFSAIGEKVLIKNGTLIANKIITVDDIDQYCSSTAVSRKYFDPSYGFAALNTLNNNTVQVSLSSDTTGAFAKSLQSPWWNQHPRITVVTTNGTAAPGTGGIVLQSPLNHNTEKLITMVAKIPIGYTLNIGYANSMTPTSVQIPTDTITATFLTNNEGTGNWVEYKIYCKNSSNTSYGNMCFYLTGTDNTNVTWYLTYFLPTDDITGHDEYINYTPLNHCTRIKNGIVYTRETNINNLFTFNERNFSSQTNIDYTDAGGNANYSIIINPSDILNIGDYFYINPRTKYNISFYIKGTNANQTNVCIGAYLSPKESDFIQQIQIQYIAATKTQLASALRQGDTAIYLTDRSNNWRTNSSSNGYSGIGFRSTNSIGYCDLGVWENYTCVSSIDISNNIIYLSTPYTGPEQNAGVYIVQTVGSTFMHPPKFSSTSSWSKISFTIGGTPTGHEIDRDGVCEVSTTEAGRQYFSHNIQYVKLLFQGATSEYKISDIQITSSSDDFHRQNDKVIFL